MRTIRESLRTARDSAANFCTAYPGHLLNHIEQLEAVICDLLDHPDRKPEEILSDLQMDPMRSAQILALANWIWEGRQGEPTKDWPWETV